MEVIVLYRMVVVNFLFDKFVVMLMFYEEIVPVLQFHSGLSVDFKLHRTFLSVTFLLGCQT